MEDFFLEIGEKRFRAPQVLKWIYHEGLTEFSGMTNLGKALRERLDGIAEIRLPEIALEKESLDGTRKWLLSVDGGNAVETVYIPESDRGTLCLSSQVGCALKCTFCSTAQQGFSRNLSIAEIIGQVLVAARCLGHSRHNRMITNVVLMGMGEPLLNFDNVVAATDLMRSDFGFGLSSRRVTLSTAGLVPKIDELSTVSDISLALSLHAPDDALRETLVPLNRKYGITEVLQSCQRYVANRPRARVTIEYTLIDGVNDHPDHARRLLKRLAHTRSKVNLIPFNPFPGSAYRPPSPEAVTRFQKILMTGGQIATIRKTRGDDIDAACGQLVGRVQNRTANLASDAGVASC